LDNATPAAIYRLFQKIATFEAENPGVKVNWVDVLVSDGNQNLNSCFRENTGRREPEPDFASQLATRNAWLTNARIFQLIAVFIQI